MPIMDTVTNPATPINTFSDEKDVGDESDSDVLEYFAAATKYQSSDLL